MNTSGGTNEIIQRLDALKEAFPVDLHQYRRAQRTGHMSTGSLGNRFDGILLLHPNCLSLHQKPHAYNSALVRLQRSTWADKPYAPETINLTGGCNNRKVKINKAIRIFLKQWEKIEGRIVGDYYKKYKRSRNVPGQYEEPGRISSGNDCNSLDEGALSRGKCSDSWVEPCRHIQVASRLQKTRNRITEIARAQRKTYGGYTRIYGFTEKDIFLVPYSFRLFKKSLDIKTTERPYGPGNWQEFQFGTYEKTQKKYPESIKNSGIAEHSLITLKTQRKQYFLPPSILSSYVKKIQSKLSVCTNNTCRAQVMHIAEKPTKARQCYYNYLINNDINDTSQAEINFISHIKRKGPSYSTNIFANTKKKLFSHYPLTYTVLYAYNCLIKVGQLFEGRSSVMMKTQQLTILIIDDEPFVLTTTSRRLQEVGFIVYTCELWGRVSGFIRSVKPDLVLLDYNMPTLKGDQICQILKKNSPNPEMKVILFSSEDEDFLRRTVLQCGADGYISKGIPPNQFIPKIKSFLKPIELNKKQDSIEASNKSILSTALVVDDSRIARRMLSQFLTKKYSCRIIEANNGQEALKRLYSFPETDVVLLDINMPVMNGIKFLEELKHNSKYPNIPIIVCSTESREEDVLRGLGLGAKGYLIKPFTPGALYSVLGQVLGRTQAGKG